MPTQTSPTTGHNLMSAVIASEPGHPFIKECLDYYDNLIYEPNNYMSIVINPIMSRILHDKWGYIYDNLNQNLPDGIKILDRTYFDSDYDITYARHSDYYGVHYCNQSWIPQNRGLIYKFCKSNDLMRIYRLIERTLSH